MMKIRLKDNSIFKKNVLDKVGNLSAKISDKTLGQLEEEGVFVFPQFIISAEDITNEQMILQSVNDSYKTSNVMGFIGYGNEKIIIESRFSSDMNDFFFQYLLERVMDMPNILELNTDSNQDVHLFNLLMFIFPVYLKKAMRKGVYKTYIRKHYDDINVKGCIDIARHIRNNTPFTSKIAYSNREFSFDNYIMELIRHTIEFIKAKTYGKELLDKVKDEVNSVVESTNSYNYHDRRKILSENKTNPLQHAYYSEYRDLQSLCIMILQYQKHNIGSGERQIHGILFDGAWLWEEYLNTLFMEHDVKLYHPMKKKGNGTQWLFTNSKGNMQGKIYPDFISMSNENRIIADAKYKPCDNIGNKDYLQILAYMFRFNSKTGYYLYPENGIIGENKLTLNRGCSYDKNVMPCNSIHVYKLGLKIPVNSKSYNGDDGFIYKIKTSEEEFIKQFISISDT